MKAMWFIAEPDPTLSSGLDWQPCGRLLAALGLRRDLATMNHSAASLAPRREPPEAVLTGQDHRDLVLIKPVRMSGSVGQCLRQ